jgi:hypothetical protein
MKKVFIVISIILCIVIVLVGCNKETSRICKLIKHDTSKDKIKFNNIEWLIKAVDAYSQLDNILEIDYIREMSRDYDLYRVFNVEEKLPEGINEFRHIIYLKTSYSWSYVIGDEYMPIGKLAGWDILYFEFITIKIDSIDDNEYVIGYRIILPKNKDNEKSIYDDITGKITVKYGTPYEDGIMYEKYSDENRNEIIITNEDNYVELEYICGDVNDYIKSIESNGL